ncbi:MULTISPECIES: hypothetical protein [Sphingomonas]|uniref:hypothetical protein n=1 Tax=Sphingomonas TaxID=13687 RepID=UPI000F7E3E87|nr:hypothetical protein [Sphingomonas sp. ABOLF]RSV15705.1 hypothetical protein CA235_07610 [Sphingomonas sp. ABOLF]GLK21255.1 hypothetical protein GCM10017606_20810 [Microbacterium terregens]
MATNQPSNAPETPQNDARDDTSAAAVLTDSRLDGTPGGGLGGTAAAEMDPQGAHPARAATPRAGAADTDGLPGHPEAEARAQSATAEPHPRAQ